MRLIDADKLIKQLFNNPYATAHGFIDMIHDTPTEISAANAWIPCSERLPEKKGVYWTSLSGYNNIKYINIYEFDPTNQSIVNFFKTNIDAWQPLPEPYKEEEESSALTNPLSDAFCRDQNIDEKDWTNVPVDTPIYISPDGEHWQKNHFAKYENGKVYFWRDGRTSYTAEEHKERYSSQAVECNYAILMEDALLEIEKNDQFGTETKFKDFSNKPICNSPQRGNQT